MEFRFRAENPHTNKWNYFGIYNVPEWISWKNKIEVQQWIGADDKKGMPIFEGDVVKREFEVGQAIFDEATLGIVDYEIEKSGYFVGKVHYRPSEGFVLNSCSKFDDSGELLEKKSGVKIYPSYAEVIGNIYDNPELLKDA